MIGPLIWLAIGAIAILGAYGKFHSEWTAEGRAACQAEIKAADDALAAKAAELRVETENHIADMVTAYEQGEKEKAPKVITKIVRAEADVRSGSIPSCVLPRPALENLNAARLSMRRETVPPAAPIDPPRVPAPAVVPAPVPTPGAPVAAPTPSAAPPVKPADREPLGRRK